ncbi:hypothetical protein F3Y22_tig00112498pilonHSYRG00149 [Hibiscus syriacus]|uniref:Uncharacterized protein n=1 Tax=Hibiscus syriacus TaxID=106335 RepID=A0A6A2XWL6_HIBSY|nr:hypothetical protein F3Y22_tig00112498pilonHSYRG00149 [Hibiscus syriacus]
MAKTNLIPAAFLLVLLLFAYGITVSEGTRVLKADDHKLNNLNTHGSAGANIANNANITNAFRPTTPGHSPGGGHPKGPTRNHKN